MEKQLVYCVDDEEDIRELYRVALESAGFSCKEFDCGDALFAELSSRLPDIILLDIMLDGEDGYAILQKLKADPAFSAVPVIMVSAKGEELSKVKGLNMGADDYIAKPFGVLELVARINANLRKGKIAPSYAYKDLAVNDRNHEITCGGKPLALTVKEYSILKMLINAAPNIVLRDDILNGVWGEGFFGESRTLDIHMSSVRKAVACSAAEIITVRGVGYRLK